MFFSAKRSLVAVGVILSPLVLAQQCYSTSGELTSDTPCDTGALSGQATTCCPSGGSCWSLAGSGVCTSNNNVTTRATCTDKTWKDPACSSICATDDDDEGVLTQCLPKSAGIWCCGEDCCDDDDDLLQLGSLEGTTSLPFITQTRTAVSNSMITSPAENGVHEIADASTSELHYSSVLVFPMTFTQAHASGMTTFTSISTTTSVNRAAMTGATTSPCSCSNSTITATATPSGFTKGDHVGIAVGSIVGVGCLALLGSAALFFVRWHKRAEANGHVENSYKRDDLTIITREVGSGSSNSSSRITASRHLPGIPEMPTPIDPPQYVESPDSYSRFSVFANPAFNGIGVIPTPATHQEQQQQDIYSTVWSPQPFVLNQHELRTPQPNPQSAVISPISPVHYNPHPTYQPTRRPQIQTSPSELAASFPLSPTSNTAPPTPAQELAAARLRSTRSAMSMRSVDTHEITAATPDSSLSIGLSNSELRRSNTELRRRSVGLQGTGGSGYPADVKSELP